MSEKKYSKKEIKELNKKIQEMFPEIEVYGLRGGMGIHSISRKIEPISDTSISVEYKMKVGKEKRNKWQA